MQRRSFLSNTVATIAWSLLRSSHLHAQSASLKRNPFQLGIASGDPLPNGTVLWTRLAPSPLAPLAGMDPVPVDVQWELAADDSMKKILQAGRVAALPEMGHSVHVEVQGLKPHTEYFYRFHAAGYTSPMGRTRTAPAKDTAVDSLRFAFASCQQYEQGYFETYRDMAKQPLDAVVFLGDYIYERQVKRGVTVRHHPIDDITSLADYRTQYAVYKSDEDLKAAHAACAWIVTPDDHEVENDWAGDVSRRKLTNFLQKRANAYQAYYENMPLRAISQPKADHMQLYRTVPYGSLAQLTVLDTRQFRTEQACNDGAKVGCTERSNLSRTMMGETQEAWFATSLSDSKAQWNVVANQVMIAEKKNPLASGEVAFNMDGWDGYTAARARMLRAVQQSQCRNPIFFTGDAHQTFVSDLKLDFNDPRSTAVASELVGTSITSGGDGDVHSANYEQFMPANPHIKYNSSRRGFFLCQVDNKKMHAVQCLTNSVTEKNVPIYAAASFTVETERKGIVQTA